MIYTAKGELDLVLVDLNKASNIDPEFAGIPASMSTGVALTSLRVSANLGIPSLNADSSSRLRLGPGCWMPTCTAPAQ
jgi:hypothetical protein